MDHVQTLLLHIVRRRRRAVDVQHGYEPDLTWEAVDGQSDDWLLKA